jgi:signal transduction histidine kinase
MPEDEEIKKITETLYQHNLELAVKNKTLALLKKLYQKSISVLAPKIMAEEIVKNVREDLNFEFAGVLTFEKDKDSLEPLAFSRSDRLSETLNNLGFLFCNIVIPDISKNSFMQKVVYEHLSEKTDNLAKIWWNLIKPADLNTVKEEAHIKTILLYPLLNGGDLLGVLMLGLNRDYNDLNAFEKSSIPGLTNVVALAIGKAYLYQDLQNANVDLKNLVKQRESLVHLVTHKVKGSFTHSKYIFAGLLDGTFGEINPAVKNMAEKGLESDNTGIETVDLVLNASNLVNGTVKYNMQIVNLRTLILKAVEEKRGRAEAKGLQVEIAIKDDIYNVLGDEFWLREVINNLLENSIRYTKQGKITVSMEKHNDKVLICVRDTGIGITDFDKKNLFMEGGRGKDAVKINVDSTGYGLYSVKLIVEAHKGRVWAESDGLDKGSAFFVELPFGLKV